MASGNAVLETANGLPLFGHGKLFGLTGKAGLSNTSYFRHGNNLSWMRLQTRKVMSTWAMMTLMNMPMG